MKFPFAKQIASFLSVTVMLTSVMPARAQTQTAAPICYADSATMEGRTANCGAVTKAGQNFAFPKLVWNEVGSVDLSVSKNVGQMPLGKPSQNLASQAAAELGLQEKDVIQAVSTYPTNVPMVFGRYSIWDASLTIDIFKLEKTGTQARMLHATFTPEHGDIWKAAGAYGSTTDIRSGALGRNPFEAFKDGTGQFRSISPSGAQVALGHAQRLVQAPVSVLAVVNSNIRPTTKKKSCGLKKCITTKYWLDMDTTWYLGVPPGQAHKALAVMPSGYCVTAPGTANATCSASEAVTAGVAFVQQEGGTFSDERVTEFIGQKTKKSWGLLGVLVLTFVASFAMSALLTAMAAPAAGAGATVTVGTSTVSSGGLLTSLGQFAGQIGSFSTYASAAAMETALTAGVLVGVGGADLNSAMKPGAPGFTSSQTSAIAAAVNPNDQGDKFVRKGIEMTRPRTVGKLDDTLAPVKNTLVGQCGISGKGSDCAGRSEGIVQRADQLMTTNQMQLYREADGTPIGY